MGGAGGLAAGGAGGAGGAPDLDADDDDVPDATDNCPAISNTDQANLDADSLGDVCDPDADGDGYACDTCGGSDCDDLDADAHPGHFESRTDAVDNDCDGSTDEACEEVDSFDHATPIGTTHLFSLAIDAAAETFLYVSHDFDRVFELDIDGVLVASHDTGFLLDDGSLTFDPFTNAFWVSRDDDHGYPEDGMLKMDTSWVYTGTFETFDIFGAAGRNDTEDPEGLTYDVDGDGLYLSTCALDSDSVENGDCAGPNAHSIYKIDRTGQRIGTLLTGADFNAATGKSFFVLDLGVNPITGEILFWISAEDTLYAVDDETGAFYEYLKTPSFVNQDMVEVTASGDLAVGEGLNSSGSTHLFDCNGDGAFTFEAPAPPD